MLYPLVGALPPGRTDFPRFKNEQERAEVLTKRGKEKTSREAEALLKTPVQVPELRHGYSGAYMDPGPPRKPLRFHGPARHYSERTGTYVDIGTMPEAVQKAAAFVHHSYLSEAAYTLADAWWQTGRKEFAARAAEILLAYAERYPDFSPVSPFATGYLSRVGHAMLGEAWWFHRLPEAFDLVKASGVLSAAEEEKIVRGLLVPAMITLRQHRVAANQQAEINAAFGKAALVTDRWDYAALALDGEYGIRAQWRLDFDRDGFTMEKEIPYHMAALGPFVELANCLEAMGVKVYDQNFKKLFDAPLVYDLTGRPPRPDLYLCAYRHYRDSRYLPLIAHLLKPEEIPPTAELSRAFRNSTLEAAGYTVLRSGDEKSGLKALTMNWGCPSHRGGTVLLNPYLYWKKYSLNEHVLRIGYGYEQSGFSYTAAAGNSLVRDGQRHSMLRANQVSLLEGVIPAGRWTSPGDRPLYSGLEWSRSAFICGDSFVLVDQVKNDRPARFDWITYLPASLVEERPVRSWTSYPSLSSEGDGYQYLVNPEKATLEKPAEEIYLAYRLQLEKETPCGALTILSPPATLFRAQAYVHWHPKLVPAVICRYGDVTNLWLVAIYTAEEKTSPPLVKVELLPVSYQGVKLPENEALALRLTNASGTFLVMTSKYEGEHTAGEKNFHGYLGASKEK